MSFTVGAKVDIFIRWDKDGEGVNKTMRASSTNSISIVLGVIDHSLSIRQDTAEEITVKIDDANVEANVTNNDGIWTIVINEAGKETTVRARKHLDGNWMRLK